MSPVSKSLAHFPETNFNVLSEFQLEKLSFQIPQLLKLTGTAKKCQNSKLYGIWIKQLLDSQWPCYSLSIIYLERNMVLMKRKEKEL